MAMNFGKSNRSIAFNPTSAFPLDARGYFESYEAAVAAALLAKEVGSTETVYYYGQTLVVVENEIATLYLIQPDNTLKPIEGNEVPNDFTLVVDEKVFTVDAQTGKLGLKGFEGAAAGSVATVGMDGSISWTVPVDAYSKTETEERIATAVAESAHLKRKIVKDLEEAQQYIANNDDADQYIYMVPTGLEEADDKYDEYMIVEIAGSKVLEKVGSWEVDLKDYATQDQINNIQEKLQGYDSSLINLDNQLNNEIARAQAAEQVNASNIQSVSNVAGTALENSNNALKNIDEIVNIVNDKVDQLYSQEPKIDEESGKNLTEEAFYAGQYFIKVGDRYVEAKEYSSEKIYYTQAVDEIGNLAFELIPHTLLTPEEKFKISAIKVSDDNEVEIHISNVNGTEGYFEEKHLSQEVVNKLNYITDVDTDHFSIVNKKLLFTPLKGRLLTAEDEQQLHYIENIDSKTFTINKVEVGVDSVGNRVEKNTLQLTNVPASALLLTIGDLNKLPTIKVNNVDSNTVVDNINNIYDVITWQDLTN